MSPARRLAAAAFCAGALFHAAALLHPGLGEPSPAWRHVLFIGVNVAAAYGFARGFRGFRVLFTILFVQQMLSHGGDAWIRLSREGRVDWASAVVLAGFPALLALAWLRPDRRSRVP